MGTGCSREKLVRDFLGYRGVFIIITEGDRSQAVQHGAPGAL